MIYLVTLQQELFSRDDFKLISVEESLQMMSQWECIEYDSETSGKDAHLCSLLCAQFGNDKADARIVVDCSTVNIEKYKGLLESKLIIGHNLKFDLQFLYNYRIIPRRVYDTMIAEQLLHLGYPHVSVTKQEYLDNNYTFPYHENDEGVRSLSYALNAVALKRLGINIDKTVRGEIIWRGLDTAVVNYAAGDVTYLEQIMQAQLKDLKEKDLLRAAKIECDFIPAIAYLEWCGIHLDQTKWIDKMREDKKKLQEAENNLRDFVVSRPDLKKYVYINTQGDLFSGFNLTPRVNINWASSAQVVKVAKILGFNTSVPDKKTGEEKDSVLEKHLKSQKGICDEFLNLYFDYQEHFKVCTSFGQGHLNAINPKTDRIHTVYKQLGAASGRMSCGSQQPNTDLAKYKQIPAKDCTYPNCQQLPADEQTRGAFTAPEGYEWCSCDFSALESRLGADIYNEQSMLDEFLHGSGDMHSLCAYMVYKKEIPRDTPIKDIKKLYPHLRKAVKPIEFSQQFGGSEFAIQGAIGCTIEEAQAFKEAYDSGFPGIADFKAKGSKFVRENGYILMCKYSGHKMYWWDHPQWVARQESFTKDFWDDYRRNHKGTGDAVARKVSKHFRAASKYDRMALNAPTQGSGIVILKMAMTNFFNWIVEKGYFHIIELSALVHDEANIIYPKELHSVAPRKLQECMEKAASTICTKLPIPAVPEISDHWVH